MNFKPTGNRLLVKPDPIESTTTSGIIIPDSAKEKPLRGTVMVIPDKNGASGTHYENGMACTMPFQAGDTILYSQYAGTEIKINDESYLIINGSEIYGILNN